jgi:tRNA modification GTPase
MSTSSDTIYALSSGALPSGVAVIRLSGPAAMQALERLAGSPIPEPRRAALRTVRNLSGDTLDEALVFAFPGPNSFTGEDCVEIHLHGSRAVVSAVFGELSGMAGLRAADAGEFSKRAYDNGKMDLLEVEGLADLLQAETEMQRRLAVEQSTGKLSQLYDGWAHRLTRARALIEAELDFADEEDVPDSVAAQVWQSMCELRAEIELHFAGGASAEIIRDGFKIALIGAPNVGKSTLLNALSGRDVAIVTDIAGTTRDVLSVDLNLNGYMVTLYDTAGMRDTADVVEQEGVKRAARTADTADLVMILDDIDSDSKQFLQDFNHKPCLRLRTKSDVSSKSMSADYDLIISAKNGVGMAELRERIAQEVEDRLGSASTLAPVRARHKKRLEETLNYVSDALNSEGMDLAIRSEYLRLAANSLGRITGRVDVEDLLGVIFSEFCIGK